MTTQQYFWGPALSLWRREMVRFLRQRSRIVGALGTPLVFWLLIGAGLGDSFRLPQADTATAASELNYLQYFFPGTVLMIVLFTAIFSMFSLIEDRREGFLQSVLTAPVHRVAIVFGKVLGSTTLATLQALLFVLLAPLAGVPLSITSFAAAFAAVLLAGLGLSGLGFWSAWKLNSSQGFHAVMNLVLLPLWLMSGALFPAAGAAPWLRWVIYINPVSYLLALIRYAMYGMSASDTQSLPALWLCLLVGTLFSAGMIAISTISVTKNR